MMNKTIIFTLLTGFMVGVLPTGAQAQSSFTTENIETILEDNMLNDVSNRYSSVVLSFFPEKATRMGYSSADDKLNPRTPQHAAQALASLQATSNLLDKITVKRLSAPKQVEYDMLRQEINTAITQAEQRPYLHDPLYYTRALDAVHDLMTKQLSSPIRQKLDLLARLSALPEVAEQAQENLSSADPVLLERALEKAYYAFLSLNEWNQFLLDGVNDTEARNQVLTITQNAKKASKSLFETFKSLSKQPSNQDFRLGASNYFARLEQDYQFTQKPALLVKNLEKNLQDTQIALTKALELVAPSVQEENEVTVVDENNQLSVQPLRKTKKKSALPIQLRNAQDFYAAAKTFMTAEIDPTPLVTLQKDAQQALAFFTDNHILPQREIAFNIALLPQYYTLAVPYLFVPPFGNQLSPKADFYLRVPSGNSLNRQTLFDQDFNTPTRKLMISGQLVPGRYYQAEATLDNTAIRRLYPAASLVNGWEAYAKRLAQRHGYLNTNEDLLVLAWDEYLHALAAYTDAQLHTQQWSYQDALDFLTQNHGLEQAQAETMLRDIATQPGEAVSYLIGLSALENAFRKYSKKFGKKFNEADFHAKLLRIGNVPPYALDKELARLYKQDKKKK